MAKQNQQLKERVRNLAIRVEGMEVVLLDQNTRIVAMADIIKRNDLEYQFADAAQRFEPCPEPVAEPVATTEAFVKVVKSIIAEPVKPKRRASANRNTYEKKMFHKAWCVRLCAIRTECDISVDMVTDHRSGKEAACNWDSIERAASLEIENDNIKQGIPNPGTIGAYVQRLHLIVSIAAHKAVMAGEYDAAKFYRSRNDLLQEIRDEIYSAHPTVTVRDSI